MKGLIVFLAAFFLAAPTWAQAVCDARGQFLQHLELQYQEIPVARGLASNGWLIEVLTSPKGSWTILATGPGGVTCVVAAGEDWVALPRLKVGPDA